MNYRLNRIILILLVIFCSCTYVYANGALERKIIIKYAHSLRIRHQYIDITLNNDYQNPELFRMKIETKAMTYIEPNWNLEDEKTKNYIESEEYRNQRNNSIKRMEEAAESNIDLTIDIDKEFFERMYNQLFEVDIKKLIEETTMSGPGADGSSASIEYGSRGCFVTIGISNQKKKDTIGEISKVNAVILEIFKKADLEGYYE